MASRSERTDGSPTILWIAWKVGEVEQEQPLCRAHRAHIFEHHPSAHGLRRRGDRCAMCAARPPRTAQLRNPRDSTTPSDEPEAAQLRGRGSRGSGRRVSPTRHDPSSPGSGRRKTRRRHMRTNNGAPRTQAVEGVAPIWRVPRCTLRARSIGARTRRLAMCSFSTPKTPTDSKNRDLPTLGQRKQLSPHAGTGAFRTCSKAPRMLPGGPTPHLQRLRGSVGDRLKARQHWALGALVLHGAAP